LKFTVTRDDQPPPPASSAIDLGQYQSFNIPPDRAGRYQVHLYGAQGARGQLIELEGGESIELQYDRTGNRLIFPEFRSGDSRPLDQDSIFDPVTGDRFRVVPILPRKSLDRVEFGVAVQNSDPLKFTRRPTHVWAEITPLDAGNNALRPAPAVFYDPQFALDTSVPVFEFVFENWPEGATQAAISLWFKFDSPAVQPNGQATVQALQAATIAEDIEGVEFRADIRQEAAGDRTWQLTVNETRDPGTEAVPARVESRPLPNLIEHRHFFGVGVTRHVFTYQERPAPTVVVTSRARIQENAIVVRGFRVQVRD
jgi:hypothetical protein